MERGAGAGRLAFPRRVAASQAFLRMKILVQFNTCIGGAAAETPTGGAAANGHRSMVLFLFLNGADIDLADKRGCTAIDRAKKERRMDIAGPLGDLCARSNTLPAFWDPAFKFQPASPVTAGSGP